jgi:NAD(P)-dependent dehydrogenase (short-subunit alcohol dehydrogenase family)
MCVYFRFSVRERDAERGEQVADIEKVKEEVDKVAKHFGRLDGCINNAGMVSQNPQRASL